MVVTVLLTMSINTPYSTRKSIPNTTFSSMAKLSMTYRQCETRIPSNWNETLLERPTGIVSPEAVSSAAGCCSVLTTKTSPSSEESESSKELRMREVLHPVSISVGIYFRCPSDERQVVFTVSVGCAFLALKYN